MLKVKHLTKIFRKGNSELKVLDNVSFEIAPRSIVSIVGHSGSGKSTLLGLCAGLDRMTSGEVEFQGQKLSELSEDQLAELRSDSMGFVFQSFQLLPTLTASENVRVPLELRVGMKRGKSSPEDFAREMLARVGLRGRENHYPSELSGGEQQRVALARAFINKPQILFADEPTGSLDNATAQEVENLLFELNREQGTTLIIVTHNLDLAAKTERVLRLSYGKLQDS